MTPTEGDIFYKGKSIITDNDYVFQWWSMSARRHII